MTPLVELDKITVARGGQVVLDGLSLHVAPGERLAVVGANGAGKTTLLRTIVGLERPSAGRVRAFGAERRSERDFRTVRTRAAYLFQEPDDQLFCPTVIEDVAFGPLNLGLREAQAYGEARATLDGLGLGHLADRVTYRLSGGEKRLVSLAAVLAMRPELLLLDEPTNALDEAYLALLTGILERQQAAMLIVSHDRPFIERLARRVLVLRAGRLRPATVHRHPLSAGAPHIHGLDPDHEHNGP